MDIQKTEAKRFPVDVTELKKGDIITAEEIQRFISAPIDSRDWNFALLGLCQWIMQEREGIGEPVTACVRDGVVSILTDEEAAEYNNRYFFHGFKRMFRGLRRQLEVDTRNLADETKKKHLRRVEVNSRTVQGAMLGRRNQLTLSPVERKTPLLLDNC